MTGKIAGALTENGEWVRWIINAVSAVALMVGAYFFQQLDRSLGGLTKSVAGLQVTLAEDRSAREANSAQIRELKAEQRDLRERVRDLEKK